MGTDIAGGGGRDRVWSVDETLNHENEVIRIACATNFPPFFFIYFFARALLLTLRAQPAKGTHSKHWFTTSSRREMPENDGRGVLRDNTTRQAPSPIHVSELL